MDRTAQKDDARTGKTSVKQPIGHKVWAIAEGYIPAPGTGPAPAMIGHETLCVLNPGDEDAELQLTVYFVDRDPAGPFTGKVPARRTIHWRINDLEEPETIPTETDVSYVLYASCPVVVQHTRFDTRQSEIGIATTAAVPYA